MTIKSRAGKIHFIHQIEKSYEAANLGDWIACPYYYFIDFFSHYTCVLHSVWSILWHEIEKDDVVIFGGGGLLDNSDELNVVLNNLFKKCHNVIIWGAGSHKYSENNIFGRVSATTPIHFDKAVLCGVRDYEHPYNLPFLPCASCLHPAFNADTHDIKIEKKIGALTHGLDISFGVSGVPSSVSNADPIGTVVDYIRSSNVMLVSSYHGAYWSMLLGRKVILLASRLCIEKYRYFRYPVGAFDGEEFDEEKLLHIASEIPAHPDFLTEARALNIAFFQKVRIYIEERLPNFSETETIQILSKRTAQLEFTLREIWGDFVRLNRRLEKIEKQSSE